MTDSCFGMGFITLALAHRFGYESQFLLYSVAALSMAWALQRLALVILEPSVRSADGNVPACSGTTALILLVISEIVVRESLALEQGLIFAAGIMGSISLLIQIEFLANLFKNNKRS